MLTFLKGLKFKIIGLIQEPITNWCLSIKSSEIVDLYNQSQPNTTSINDVSGNLKFIGEGTTNFLIKTSTGFSPVKRTLRTVEYDVWHLELEDGKVLDCADQHLVMLMGEMKQVNEISTGDLVLTIEGNSPVRSVIKTERKVNMFDLELDDQDHTFYTNGILSHNTTVVAMYILWMACFEEDKLCIIASKAMNHAVEIMGRIKFAYEELPAWLKPGCRYYSRTSIEFDNGSKIKSEATSEKTGRGSSPSFLMIDEIAFLSKRIQDEMWASLAPALSTGGKFVLTSTPNGDSDLFATLWRGANAELNSFFPVQAMWYQHPERGQAYYEEMLGKLGPIKTSQELDCRFISSDSLLIDSLKLSYLKSSPPITENMGFKFWRTEQQIGGEGRTYLVGVDPATGTGSDFTVVQVIEFPSMEQVAELRLNVVNIPLIYAKLKWLFKFLRRPIRGTSAEILWSFERNGVGEALVALIQNDESEDGGIYLDGVELYSETPGRLGMHTGGRSKLLACMQLKGLVERGGEGIKINSSTLLFELKNFIATGGSYAAKQGATDDCVMALTIVVRLLARLATYDDAAREVVYETVNPDLDLGVAEDQFGDDVVPFVF